MNLKSALKLYDILRDYFPSDYVDHFDFVRQLIHNIASGENKGAYADALDVMLGRPMEADEMTGYTTGEIISLFSDKLIEVNIHELITFCESIGI